MITLLLKEGAGRCIGHVLVFQVLWFHVSLLFLLVAEEGFDLWLTLREHLHAFKAVMSFLHAVLYFIEFAHKLYTGKFNMV